MIQWLRRARCNHVFTDSGIVKFDRDGYGDIKIVVCIHCGMQSSYDYNNIKESDQ